MTSRRKIQAITKSAKHTSCSVLLKTRNPPGIMIVEGKSEENVKQWIDSVKVISSNKEFRVVTSYQRVTNARDYDTKTIDCCA